MFVVWWQSLLWLSLFFVTWRTMLFSSSASERSDQYWLCRRYEDRCGTRHGGKGTGLCECRARDDRGSHTWLRPATHRQQDGSRGVQAPSRPGGTIYTSGGPDRAVRIVPTVLGYCTQVQGDDFGAHLRVASKKAQRVMVVLSGVLPNVGGRVRVEGACSWALHSLYRCTALRRGCRPWSLTDGVSPCWRGCSDGLPSGARGFQWRRHRDASHRLNGPRALQRIRGQKGAFTDRNREWTSGDSDNVSTAGA